MGFYWREQAGTRILICAPLENAGFVNAFSTRLGGVSPFPGNSLNLAGYDEDTAENIRENRNRFLSALGTSPDQMLLATVWQIHGDGIKIIRSKKDADSGSEKYDALASEMKGILAAVKTADCVPILIGEPDSKAFAAVHAGWRGTSLSIVQKTVSLLSSEFNAAPKSMIAAIGPAAGPDNYEVGAEVLDALVAANPNNASFFYPTRPGHSRIDLPKINRNQLISAGVSPENIFIAPYCTMSRSDLFFSYRIDREKFGRTGRLLSVIGRLR